MCLFPSLSSLRFVFSEGSLVILVVLSFRFPAELRAFPATETAVSSKSVRRALFKFAVASAERSSGTDSAFCMCRCKQARKNSVLWRSWRGVLLAAMGW